MTVTQSSRERSSTADVGTSNLVAVEPGAAIREDTPPGSVIQYSDYELDTLPACSRAGWPGSKASTYLPRTLGSRSSTPASGIPT